MIYLNELSRHKNTNFEHPKGLQTFKGTSLADNTANQEKDKLQELPERQSQCFKNCFHGHQYIWNPDERRTVRIFWFLIAVGAFVGCIAMYFMVTKLHDDQHLVTVVKSSHVPIYTIPFPSVALCPVNNINWIRHKAAEEKFLPLNASDKVRQDFSDLLAVMEHMTFSMMAPVGDFVRRRPLPPVIENIVLTQLAQFMSFRCNEVFVSCIFDGTVHDCCKIFMRERTDKGVCLVFNSLISKESKMKQLTDQFYPWRVRGAKELSGLSFVLRYNGSLVRPGSKIPFTFTITIKQAQEWNDPLFHILYPDTHSDIAVTPILTETASSARRLDPQKRNCLFGNEKSKKYDRIDGLPYNYLNCQTQCQHNYVMKHCNCSLSLFFPQKHDYPKRECQVSDLTCMYMHRDVFNYLKGAQQDDYINDTRRGMTCDCVDNCMSLVFLVAASTQRVHSFSVNKSDPEIHAHVYYTHPSFTKYESHLEYTFLDIVAYFGGVLGLFLGASILSFVEIVYALIRTILIAMLKKWRQIRQLRRIQIVKSIEDNNK